MEVPKQDEPINEYGEEEMEVENYDFSDEELKIIGDDNPPDFYDPFEVLKLSRWIELAAKAMIGFIIVSALLNFSTSRNISLSYFAGSPYLFLINIVAFLIIATNIAIGVLLTYVPLKALSRILRILMQMEFNSRKGTQSNPLIE